MITKSIETSQQHIIMWSMCVILFLMSPLLACGLIMLMAFYSNDKAYAKPLLTLLPLLIFILQLTRTFREGEPSDWVSVSYWYHKASSMDFLSFIRLRSKAEYGYDVLGYLGNWLTDDNFILWASFIVTLTFGIAGIAVYKFWRHTGCDIRYLIAALSMLFFFNEFIGNCNNLLRMELSASIMLYGFVERYTTGKIPWLWMIIALSIHMGIIILYPLIFFKSSKIISIKQLLYLSGIFLIVLLILYQFAGAFNSSSLYIFRRISTTMEKPSAKEANDTMRAIAAFVYAAAVIPCFVKVMFFDKLRYAWRIEIYNFAGLFCLTCICLTPLLFVATRFYITRFFFMPLFFPYLFIRQNETITTLYLLGIFAFFYLRFCLYQSVFLDIPNKIFGWDIISILTSSPYI